MSPVFVPFHKGTTLATCCWALRYIAIEVESDVADFNNAFDGLFQRSVSGGAGTFLAPGGVHMFTV